MKKTFLISVLMLFTIFATKAQNSIRRQTITNTQNKSEAVKKDKKRNKKVSAERKRQKQAEQEAERIRLEAQYQKSLEDSLRWAKEAEEEQRKKKNEERLNSLIQNLSNNMVYVEGGTYIDGDNGKRSKSKNKVTVSSFYMCKYEITQEFWQAVFGGNPSKFQGSQRPVENVTLDDVLIFTETINRLSGKQYRLPTPAEWEYAFHGGNRSNGYKYSGSDDLNLVAWYHDNSYNTTHDIGTRQPNELGIYDMSGNVCEWCESNFHSVVASLKHENNRNFFFKGGDYNTLEEGCRISSNTLSNNCLIGFRLVVPCNGSIENKRKGEIQSREDSQKILEQLRLNSLKSRNIIK